MKTYRLYISKDNTRLFMYNSYSKQILVYSYIPGPVMGALKSTDIFNAFSKLLLNKKLI